MIHAMSKRAVMLMFVLLLGACASQPQQWAETSTFVIVRHAEKSTSDPLDPPLAEAGVTRARVLSALLSDESVVAIYATVFKRSLQTAKPTSDAHGIAVTTYDAKQPAAALARQLRNAHASGTVLVVGHSNTVPDIVAAFCQCTVEPLADTDYDRLYRVHIDGSGRPVLQQLRYGTPSTR